MTDDLRPSETAEGGHRRAVLVGMVVAAVLVALDQATKQLAEAVLEPGRFVPLLGEHIGWQLVYNPGGAFGVRAHPWIFLVVTVIVVVVVARALPRTTSRVTATGYGMLLAGALGNVIDRLFREGVAEGPSFGGGAVVDFVAWGAFPRFNVADSAITVGFVLLVVGLWREERQHVHEHGEEPTATDASDTGGIQDAGDAPDAVAAREGDQAEDAGDAPDAAVAPEGGQAEDAGDAPDAAAAPEPAETTEAEDDRDVGAPRGRIDAAAPDPDADPDTDADPDADLDGATDREADRGRDGPPPR